MSFAAVVGRVTVQVVVAVAEPWAVAETKAGTAHQNLAAATTCRVLAESVSGSQTSGIAALVEHQPAGGATVVGAVVAVDRGGARRRDQPIGAGVLVRGAAAVELIEQLNRGRVDVGARDPVGEVEHGAADDQPLLGQGDVLGRVRRPQPGGVDGGVVVDLGIDDQALEPAGVERGQRAGVDRPGARERDRQWSSAGQPRGRVSREGPYPHRLGARGQIAVALPGQPPGRGHRSSPGPYVVVGGEDQDHLRARGNAAEVVTWTGEVLSTAPPTWTGSEIAGQSGFPVSTVVPAKGGLIGAADLVRNGGRGAHLVERPHRRR